MPIPESHPTSPKPEPLGLEPKSLHFQEGPDAHLILNVFVLNPGLLSLSPLSRYNGMGSGQRVSSKECHERSGDQTLCSPPLPGLWTSTSGRGRARPAHCWTDQSGPLYLPIFWVFILHSLQWSLLQWSLPSLGQVPQFLALRRTVSSPYQHFIDMGSCTFPGFGCVFPIRIGLKLSRSYCHVVQNLNYVKVHLWVSLLPSRFSLDLLPPTGKFVYCESFQRFFVFLVFLAVQASRCYFFVPFLFKKQHIMYILLHSCCI